MDLTMLTCLVVGSSFALYIGIAFWSRAQDTRDFYVAGKHVHPIANGMPTVCQRYGRGLDVRCFLHFDGWTDRFSGLRRQVCFL